MKHKILYMIGAGLMLMAVTSACRKQSDILQAYDHEDRLVFDRADSSFAAKFDILWNGLNQYYPLWDYEASQGVDWDAVYDEFYPQFEALDKRGKNAEVTDQELTELLSKCFGKLHDGHYYVTMTNHKTGSTLANASFSALNDVRDDVQAATTCLPNLYYYANPANGEIETDNEGNPMARQCSADANDLLMYFLTTPGVGYLWINDQIKELEALPSLTEMQEFRLNNLRDLKRKLMTMGGIALAEGVKIYNSLQASYSFLNVPGFDPIDMLFANGAEISVGSALFKGNIAYLRISDFSLSFYLKTEESKLDMSNPSTRQIVERVRDAWQFWFDNIQALHRKGTLGGVIIDLRSNGGGLLEDAHYVMGALVPSGGLTYGYHRFKRGTGRYDYSPLMPAVMPTMNEPHETITEPIVVLCNSKSVSMAEISTMSAKGLPNGTAIGKRTRGAICGLSANKNNSYNYAGYVGVKGVTPVYSYVPMVATFTFDKEVLESYGVTPDIEVDLDITRFQTDGKDSQLDRALQFIRTGK
ncbi:MAG: hypothetical protein J5533_04465 [Bacteroidales bacterium]|nr:hypothetical protein [Bacteroidales bacterium]